LNFRESRFRESEISPGFWPNQNAVQPEDAADPAFGALCVHLQDSGPADWRRGGRRGRGGGGRGGGERRGRNAGGATAAQEHQAGLDPQRGRENKSIVVSKILKSWKI